MNLPRRYRDATMYTVTVFLYPVYIHRRTARVRSWERSAINIRFAGLICWRIRDTPRPPGLRICVEYIPRMEMKRVWSEGRYVTKRSCEYVRGPYYTVLQKRVYIINTWAETGWLAPLWSFPQCIGVINVISHTPVWPVHYVLLRESNRGISSSLQSFLIGVSQYATWRDWKGFITRSSLYVLRYPFLFVPWGCQSSLTNSDHDDSRSFRKIVRTLVINERGGFAIESLNKLRNIKHFWFYNGVFLRME